MKKLFASVLSVIGSLWLLMFPAIVLVGWHEEEFYEGGATTPLWIWIIVGIFLVAFAVDVARKMSKESR